MMQSDFNPQPDELATAHRQAATQHIHDLIREAGGALSFDRFMEEALYAPGLGYYVAGASKFGATGDFLTAPESGSLFAKCLAREIAGLLDVLPDAQIIEFGAGTGRLAEDLLRALSQNHQLPSAYRIMELSPDLQRQQKERLEPLARELGIQLQWLSEMPAERVDGIMLANEVVDAFPVTRFRVEKNRIRRARVRIEGEGVGWDWTEDLLADGAEFEIAQAHNLPDGYESEVCPRASAWVRELANTLRRGAILIIDYGYPAEEYYLPDRAQGTLRCHYRHQAHNDPFRLIGLQDITCHVNFSQLSDAAQSSGLSVLGYTSQEAYLLSLGLLDFASFTNTDDERTRIAKAQEVKRLVLPSQMGESFKVLALGKGAGISLDGFSLRDRTLSL